MVRRVLVVKDEKGRTRAYDEALLRERITEDFEAKVAEHFPNSKWETLTLKDEWTGADDAAVERAILELNHETGTFQREGTRFLPVLCARAIKEWSFPDPISEASVEALPAAIGKVVKAICFEEMRYDDLSDPFISTL